jgi:predicted nucleic acid-binding protein
MIVVADTSPISYLVLIDEIEILPKLYGEIIIPPAVFDELTASGAPAKVLDWVTKSPDWFVKKNLLGRVEPQLIDIDKGEREAIQLAIDIRAELLLIDDLAGRQAAQQRGLKIIGLIGVLNTAKEKNLIDIESVIVRLRVTNFFIAENLLEYLRTS